MDFQGYISLVWKNYLIHIIDILIVAYIIYKGIMFIRGTRAVQVLSGITVLALLTVVTKQFVPFHTLGWLLGNFWMLGLIMIAIIFQPELRSALAQLGSKPIGRIFMPNLEKRIIRELVTGVRELSLRRIGALLVLEQETGLKNYVETGVLINGEISKELLLSIFAPSSILHDGAVIINRTKLAAASCILPVSDNSLLSRDLGTRHLAAIGITEHSDAIVIVVSEETGAVSLVHKRKLEYNINLDELQKKLSSLQEDKMERKFSIRSGAFGGKNSEEDYVQKN